MEKESGVARFFKWVERAKTIFDILALVSFVAVLRTMLIIYTRIPQIWLAPIYLVSATMFWWIFVRFVSSKISFFHQPITPEGPLELRAISLSRELSVFLKEIGPQPADHESLKLWQQKLEGGYSRRFLPRIRAVRNELLERGQSSLNLNSSITDGFLITFNRIQFIAQDLKAMAVKLDD